jgi:non-ribosomal peptide synthase protein (TIGR01720 family)
MLARAREAGIRLSPRQVFEHPTVAGLAAVAQVQAPSRMEPGPTTGPAPLIPIQRWFFDQCFADPHHWNLSMLHEIRPPVDRAALARAVRECLAHHDALRLRFTRDEGMGWSQRAVDAGREEPPLTFIDLRTLPVMARRSALESATARLQTGLDLERGPLARFALFDLGPGLSGRLLVTVHHLAMDIVSWQILHQDLEAAYTRAAAGGAVELPPRTTSFLEWARRLEEHARSPVLREELGYWLDEARRQAPPLPRENPQGVDGMNREASVRRVVERLGEEETRILLQEVPRAYRTQVSDVLLTALVQAFCRWTGQPRLLVELEGHGREQLFDDVDLSRTVGWFTSLYPVLLDVAECPDEEAALKRIKEQLRAVPNGGIGYGLLRHLSPDPAVAEALRGLPGAEVVFNYGGREGSRGTGAWLGPAAEDRGPTRSPYARRAHLLEIDGQVSGGRLEMHWHYSEAVHRRSTIEGLARGFAEALRRIIAHCTSPGATGYTPSDFPGAKLDQAGLDRFLSRLGRTAKEAGV